MSQKYRKLIVINPHKFCFWDQDSRTVIVWNVPICNEKSGKFTYYTMSGKIRYYSKLIGMIWPSQRLWSLMTFLVGIQGNSSMFISYLCLWDSRTPKCSTTDTLWRGTPSSVIHWWTLDGANDITGCQIRPYETICHRSRLKSWQPSSICKTFSLCCPRQRSNKESASDQG